MRAGGALQVATGSGRACGPAVAVVHCRWRWVAGGRAGRQQRWRAAGSDGWQAGVWAGGGSVLQAATGGGGGALQVATGGGGGALQAATGCSRQRRAAGERRQRWGAEGRWSGDGERENRSGRQVRLGA
jgi:hypothetical protein